MTPDECRDLFFYDSWANRRTLEACAQLTADQFLKDLGSSFRSVRDTLAHILGAEWVWLERFRGNSPSGMPPASSYPDLAALRLRWAEVESDLLAYVGGLSAADLDRSVEQRTKKGDVYHNPLRQVLQHLANHGSYHRGQVTTMLRQLGATPVSTDLIAFYRAGAPRPA